MSFESKLLAVSDPVKLGDKTSYYLRPENSTESHLLGVFFGIIGAILIYSGIKAITTGKTTGRHLKEITGIEAIIFGVFKLIIGLCLVAYCIANLLGMNGIAIPRM